MGATGVGKEVVARYIHEHSEFSKGPLVAVNCAALPESLFERELFGHKKGAFTGADRDTAGVVAAASGGTLFLDEIGELPMAMQAKLLRLLQESTYRRVGDVTEYHADIRVLAATNCDLRKQVDDKIFREDLWYRINAFEVRIPLLRERPEDIAPLTDLFLEEQSKKFGIEFWMDQQVRRLFERYPWPGNVRELQSAVRAGAARARGDGRIRVRHLPHSLRESRTKKPTPILSLQQHLEVEERRIILHALRQCKNSRSQAARYLGIGRNTLYEKMQRLGIALDKEAKG
jgi:transcriptional regulator with PAS, ATPase and Fis domain